jgi:hypothetical protein
MTGSCAKYLSLCGFTSSTHSFYSYPHEQPISLSSRALSPPHEHPVDEPTTARARGRRPEDVRSHEYISPTMTRVRWTRGHRTLRVQLTDNNTRMPKVRTSDARTRGCGPFLPQQQRQLTSLDRRRRLPSPRRQRLLHPPPTLVSILHDDDSSLLLQINSGGSILHGYLHRWRPPWPPCAWPPATPRLHPPWQRNHPTHDLDPAS